MGRPCACCGGCHNPEGDDNVCWNVYREPRNERYLFQDFPDDSFLYPNEPDDLKKNCGCVVVDYQHTACPSHGDGYQYFNPSKVKKFLGGGGIYITNCEWDNGNQCRDGQEGGCDKDGAVFNDHMAAIGCSIRRDLPTAATEKNYTSLGSPLFKDCTIRGDATASLKNGVPLLSVGGRGGEECYQGGTVCAGQKISKGTVITFGDSNIRISGPFRENMFDILKKGKNPLVFSQQPLP